MDFFFYSFFRALWVGVVLLVWIVKAIVWIISALFNRQEVQDPE